MPVTIYTRSTCAPCRTVKYFLEKKGITFVEKNIDEPSNSEEFNSLAEYPMVPLLLIGDKKVQGANIPLISSLLMV